VIHRAKYSFYLACSPAQVDGKTQIPFGNDNKKWDCPGDEVTGTTPPAIDSAIFKE